LNRITEAHDALLAGKPVANMQLRVVDENLRDRPVGVWGDVWISGTSLAEGYVAEPAVTAQRFRSGPAKQRSFALSERGRWRSDGRFELQPAEQGSPMIGGTRVDLVALAKFVREQNAVVDATCVIRTGHDGRPRVVAYVGSSDAELRNTLRQALVERVPPVAGPAEVVVLPELPRLPDGRVDARTLPSPEDHVGQSSSTSFVEPQTATEKMLAAIWCDLLGLARVSSRDNFFDLGGHSLLAMQAITKMEQNTGRQVAARRYMFQTLAQLASSYEEPVAPAPQKTGLVGRLLGALRGSNRG
jgi:hypothetical protein